MPVLPAINKVDRPASVTAGDIPTFVSGGDIQDSGIAASSLASQANLANYLQLSGGTLTGALNGTSATFSANVQAQTMTIALNGGTGVVTIGNVQRNGTLVTQVNLGNNPLINASSIGWNDGTYITTAPTLYSVLHANNMASGVDIHMGHQDYSNGVLIDSSNGGTIYVDGGSINLQGSGNTGTPGTIEMAGGKITDAGTTVYSSGTFTGTLTGTINPTSDINLQGYSLSLNGGGGSGGYNLFLDSAYLYHDSIAYSKADGSGRLSLQATVFNVNYNDDANNAGFVVTNSNSGAGAQATIAVKNNAGVLGGMALFSSGFSNAALKNNVTFFANNAIQFLSNNTVASGGTSPIQFLAGGYGVSPQLTVSPAGYIQLATTASPPAAVAGGIYYSGTHLFVCLTAGTWTQII